MKTLKLWNGGDWKARHGHLYVAAYSVKEACELCREAYRKVRPDAPEDYYPITTHELNVYFNKGCWGNPMDGVTPERGVWWSKELNDPPIRLV